MPIVYHARKNNNSTPDCTIAFDYDNVSNIMFIAWAKPNTKMGDTFSRKRGYHTSVKRVERLRKAYYENCNIYELPANIRKSFVGDNINFIIDGKELREFKCINVAKSIKTYLPRAYRYFKEADPNNSKIIIY